MPLLDATKDYVTFAQKLQEPGYHSGSQWAAMNWKLPPAVSHLVLDESETEQCYLTA